MTKEYKKNLHYFEEEIRISPQPFRVSISLPLHASEWIESILTVCLIRIHYLTLFVVNKKSRPPKKNITKYTLNYFPGISFCCKPEPYIWK